MSTSRKALISDCYEIRKALKARGWKFSPEARAWEKVGYWQAIADVEREVRAYAGVRNRKIGSIALA